MYYDQKRFIQAEVEYRKAVELDPKGALAHKNLGLVCLKRKQYEDAEKHFQESIRFDPASVVPLVKIRIRSQYGAESTLDSEAAGQ